MIGIKESHLITIAGKLTRYIIINGITRTSNVTTPHKTISTNVCKSVVIFPSPPLTMQQQLRLLKLLRMKVELNLEEASSQSHIQ